METCVSLDRSQEAETPSDDVSPSKLRRRWETPVVIRPTLLRDTDNAKVKTGSDGGGTHS
jgi:hypothetical protein